MSNTFIKTLLVTAGIAAVPALSQAAAQPAAMQSCVAAFVQSLTQHVTPVKVRESRFINNSLSPETSNSLVLIANDAHDKHIVGQAICRLDAHGQVIGLEAVPAYSLLP
jgi:hypothetical protein